MPTYVKKHERVAWLPLYQAQYPDRCLWGRKGWRVKKWFLAHFTDFCTDVRWQKHNEAMAERHWKKLLQSAQDTRFKQAEVARAKAERLRLKALGREDQFEASERLLKIEQNRLIWAKERQFRKEERAKKKEVAREIWNRNMKLSADRKRARQERDEFMAKWRKKYSHLFRPIHTKKKDRDLRASLEKKFKVGPGVWSHIKKINTMPGKCYWCGVDIPHGGEADHVMPLNKGGSHSVANIVASCVDCNRKKHTKLPNEMDQPSLMFA